MNLNINNFFGKAFLQFSMKNALNSMEHFVMGEEKLSKKGLLGTTLGGKAN